MKEMIMKARKELLQNLLHCEAPEAINRIRKELGGYEWDWDKDEPLVTVTPQDVIHILERYLNGTLSAKQVESWADALELREDVDMKATAHIMAELANPVAVLTPEDAKSYIASLK